jgi:hypothetical protein
LWHYRRLKRLGSGDLRALLSIAAGWLSGMRKSMQPQARLRLRLQIFLEIHSPMGTLFEMPPIESRKATTAVAACSPAPTERNAEVTEMKPAEFPFDLNLWLSAPRERNPSYIPVYSAVSHALQTALRRWVGEWLGQHPEAIERRVSGYSLVAFSCTRPYRGRTTNLFTYDVQQTSVVDHALRVAGRSISEEASRLDGIRRGSGQNAGPRLVPDKVAEFVREKRRPIYRMFHVETLLMDEVLKFTQINIPKLGLEKAAAELRSAFAKHLRRFTDEFDMSEHCDELLYLATEALRTRKIEEEELPIAA